MKYDELEELDGVNDTDIMPEEIIELTDSEGLTYEYYVLGNVTRNGKDYVFLTPAEEMGDANGTVVVYEENSEKQELIAVTDLELLNSLYEEFFATFEGEYIKEDFDDTELNQALLQIVSKT